jgi:acyl-CoA thioesterase-1
MTPLMTILTTFRRPGTLLAVCLALAAGCGGNGTPERASNQQRSGSAVSPAADEDSRPKVVALGDSLTAGLGLLQSQAYPALLQQKIDADGYAYDVVNAGVSGDTSAGGLRRLDWALDGDVRVLILALGANDGLRGLSVNEMKNNLSRIIERAKEEGIVVILAGMEAPPNYGPDYTAAFRRVYPDLAKEHGVRLLPFLLDNVAGDTALNQSDGIHPNARGAQIIADGIWVVLQPVLDQLTTS